LSRNWGSWGLFEAIGLWAGMRKHRSFSVQGI
jgi:hypothetical protein